MTGAAEVGNGRRPGAVRVRSLGLAVLAAAGVAGCLDTGEPPLQTEARIVHLAPGAGAFDVVVDEGTLLKSLFPLQYTFALVSAEAHTYGFEDDGSATTVEVPVADLVAVLLADARSPEARAYTIERLDTLPRYVVINADTGAADLTVLLEGPDTVSVTLGPGVGEEVLLRSNGSYGVRVHTGDVELATALVGFTVDPADGFLAVYPAVPDSVRYDRIVF